MTTLEINGKRVQVDDSFKSLSPEEQQRTVDEIAAQMGLMQSQAPNTNPGVSPEAPPEMFLNPQTGQYTSRELLTNHMMQNQTAPTTATGATIMGAGRGATLGGIDEISGYLNAAIPGQGTMAERNTFGREMARAAEDAGQQSNPDDMLTSEIAGAVSVPFYAPFQAMKLAPRVLGSALSGAGMGAIYGGLTGEGEEDRIRGAQQGAIYGGAAGTVAPLIGAGAQKWANARAQNKAIRAASKAADSAAQQRAASGQQYKAFEGAGVELHPSVLTRLRGMLEQRLTAEGMSTLPNSGRTPRTRKLLDLVAGMDDDVQKAVAAGQKPLVPMTAIEELRREGLDLASDINAIGRSTPDARLGNIAVDEIDNFVNSLQQADVGIGDPQLAKDALTKARALWAQSNKTQLLENILDQQDNYLGGPASAIRNRVATLLRNPKTRKQFTEAEQKMLRQIIGGNTLSRAIRLLGNGIGRQMQAVGGATLGGIPGALAGIATGELSAAAANQGAIRAAERARDVVASGALKNVTQANPQIERLIEAIVRRAGATVPQ